MHVRSLSDRVCASVRMSLQPLEMLPVVPGPPSSKDVLAYSLMAQSAAGLPPGRAGEVSAAGPAPGRVGEVSRELQRMRLHLIMLDRVHDVTICGSGTVDGRGGAWWHLRRQRADVLAPVLLKMVRLGRGFSGLRRLAASQLFHRVPRVVNGGNDCPEGSALLVAIRLGCRRVVG